MVQRVDIRDDAARIGVVHQLQQVGVDDADEHVDGHGAEDDIGCYRLRSNDAGEYRDGRGREKYDGYRDRRLCPQGVIGGVK